VSSFSLPPAPPRAYAPEVVSAPSQGELTRHLWGRDHGPHAAV